MWVRTGLGGELSFIPQMWVVRERSVKVSQVDIWRSLKEKVQENSIGAFKSTEEGFGDIWDMTSLTCPLDI